MNLSVRFKTLHVVWKVWPVVVTDESGYDSCMRLNSARILVAVLAMGALGLPFIHADEPRPAKTMRPVVRGTRHAVSSRTPQATEVAQNILRAGGNAFDAAVAGQAVLSVTDPASNGVGGDAFILIYDAKAGKVLSINGGGPAPRLATIEWYRANNDNKLPIDESLLAGTVPGTVDLWYTMLDRWGTMSFAEVLQPAIELAEKGFPVGERLARGIANVEKLKKYPTTSKIYLPNGKPLRTGEVFRNPGLARTLQRLVEAEAEKSPAGRHEALKAARDRFYKGDIAREMAAFSEANGGLFRYDDFASYEVKIEEPVSYRYRGYDVYKNPSANQGPSELFTLGILEGFDLKAMGHNSADYIHVNVEAIKLAFADREKFLADQDFVPIPFRTLLSPEYIAGRRTLVNLRRASSRLQPGSPEKFDSRLKPVHRTIETAAIGGDHKGDTSYIAVVDSKRNAVSWTPSLHSSWGTGVVLGELGFSLNCRGDYFWLDENHANSLEVGKRPRSTLTPTLILKDGKPFMAVGSPGGDDQCMRIMQTFLNVVEFDMNIQAAIEAPRWSTESFPSSVFPHGTKKLQLSVEERIPQSIRKQLQRRGHKVEVSGPWTLGATSAIVVDPESGVLSAGADPRGDNYALAW